MCVYHSLQREYFCICCLNFSIGFTSEQTIVYGMPPGCLQVRGAVSGDWEFRHAVGVERWSFGGWLDLYSRRMPRNGKVHPPTPSTAVTTLRK